MLEVIHPDADTFGRYQVMAVDEEENEMQDHDIEDDTEYEEYYEYDSSTPSQWNTGNIEIQLDVMLIALGVIAGLLFMRGIFE